MNTFTVVNAKKLHELPGQTVQVRLPRSKASLRVDRHMVAGRASKLEEAASVKALRENHTSLTQFAQNTEQKEQKEPQG